MGQHAIGEVRHGLRRNVFGTQMPDRAIDMHARAAFDRRGNDLVPLLVELIERCTRGPWQQMLAVIGNSANQGSIALHRSCGFRMVGTLERVGFKHGQWVDTVLMQRSL